MKIKKDPPIWFDPWHGSSGQKVLPKTRQARRQLMRGAIKATACMLGVPKDALTARFEWNKATQRQGIVVDYKQAH